MPQVYDDAVTISNLSRALPRAMHGPSSSRRRSTVAPRRISSAPDLRTSSSTGSASTSLAESSSAESLSFSHSSDLPRWHHDDIQIPEAFVAPAALTHDAARVRPSRSASDPPPARESLPSQSPIIESASRTLEDMHRMIREIQRRDRRRGARGLWIAIRAFFGYGPEGSVARRDVMSLAGKILFGIGQVGATIALLSIAARNRSPTNSTINEWQACRRPLGVWCAIWCVRVVLGSIMAIWGYQRKINRPSEHTDRTHGDTTDRMSHISDGGSDARSTRTGRRSPHPRIAEAEASRRVSAITFARLTTLLSLLSLTWFVTAHVLIYTSVHTCRMSSPHLWWLTFGIICIGYLIIVEVILVAFVVFILGPLIFLLLNLILICMGRHPIRHHMNTINPDVGKMSQRAVDLIPLVLYIPAPVPKASIPKGGISTSQSSDMPVDPPLAIPDAAHVHSYPPATERPVVFPSTDESNNTSRRRRLFTFRRIRPRKSDKGDIEKPKDKETEGQGYLYEDKWERGDYPFVKLEDNRAACAICLCDFEAPRRVRYSVGSRPAEDLDRAEKGNMGQSPTKSHSGGELRLSDPGEGAQPLRLLECAHVFHKSCLDPWLIEVSGRCPVCQRAVEIDVPAKPEGRRRRGTAV